MSKMRKIDGYITVEMSFILPMVCFLLVVLISFFFYMMDYGIVKGIVTKESLKATDVIKTNGKVKDGAYSMDELNSRNIFYLLHPQTKQIQAQTKTNIKREIESKVFLGKVKKLSVNVTSKKVETDVIVDVKVPILGSVQASGIRLFRMKIKESQGIYMEAESVRRWDLFANEKD